MTKLLLTCGVLAALAACATSQPSPSAAASSVAPATAAAPAADSAPAATTAAAPQTAAAPAKPKLVCEETEQMGSHFPQRVCMTPEQMEARRKAAQAAMQNFQMQGAQCAQGGGACGGPPR